MEAMLLLAIVIVSVMIIPLGLPGTWIIAAAALGYRILVPDGGVGYFTVGVMFVLAVISAIIEMTLSASYAKKYGGSRRAGWGNMGRHPRVRIHRRGLSSDAPAR